MHGKFLLSIDDNFTEDHLNWRLKVSNSITKKQVVSNSIVFYMRTIINLKSNKLVPQFASCLFKKFV